MKQQPIIVISGAIGSGKGTLIHALAHELDLTWVPTHTTRAVRKDDHVLSQRIFDTEATFERYKERKEFIETTEIGGHQYGLLRADFEKHLRHGKPVILEVSVSGGQAIEKEYTDVLSLFITAPKHDRMERVKHRHLPKDELAERFAVSDQEEKEAGQHYDYIIENPEHYPHVAIESATEIIADTFPEICS